MTGACADITSRKEAAEALRENEERLRAIFNQAAVGIAVAALDGRFLDMNRKFTEILGYSDDELRRRDVHRHHPSRRSAATPRPRCGNCSPGSIPEYSLEKRYLRKDGSVVWSLTTVTLLKDAAGQPQGSSASSRTSRAEEAEAALREETRILELLNETGETLASEARPAGAGPGRHRCRDAVERRAVWRVLLQHDRRERRFVPALHACRARRARPSRTSAIRARRRCSARRFAGKPPFAVTTS